jgi:hypothetical protein
MTEPKTINITPSWQGLVPAFLALIEDGTAEGRNFAVSEIARMAKVADLKVQAMQAIEAAQGKFTVLLMMPMDWHGDQSSASECVTREWVEAADVDGACVAAITAAMDRAEAEGSETSSEDWAVLAVYPNHIFDLFQA